MNTQMLRTGDIVAVENGSRVKRAVVIVPRYRRYPDARVEGAQVQDVKPDGTLHPYQYVVHGKNIVSLWDEYFKKYQAEQRAAAMTTARQQVREEHNKSLIAYYLEHNTNNLSLNGYEPVVKGRVYGFGTVGPHLDLNIEIPIKAFPNEGALDETEAETRATAIYYTWLAENQPDYYRDMVGTDTEAF